jgi:hypothetical protein
MVWEHAMSRTFICYIHKPGIMTPELRIVACEAHDSLVEVIAAESRTWPDFDLIEVYDEEDKRLLRFDMQLTGAPKRDGTDDHSRDSLLSGRAEARTVRRRNLLDDHG